MDPVGRREIRDLLQEEAKRGKTVLLNSHLLSEIERTCDRVAVLRGGRVAAAGRIEDLTASGSRYKLVATGVDDALLGAFRETGASVERVNGHFDLSARDLDHVNALVDRLRAAGGKLQELTPLRTSLEDVFVDLVRDQAGGLTAPPPSPEPHVGATVMRAFVASVQEVFREAAARWTLIAYFALSTLFILLFAAAVNLDIVDGALAGMKLFGQSVDLPDRQIRIDELVLGFESTFSGVPVLRGPLPGALRDGAPRAAAAGEGHDRPVPLPADRPRVAAVCRGTRAACCSRRRTWRT